MRPTRTESREERALTPQYRSLRTYDKENTSIKPKRPSDKERSRSRVSNLDIPRREYVSPREQVKDIRSSMNMDEGRVYNDFVKLLSKYDESQLKHFFDALIKDVRLQKAEREESEAIPIIEKPLIPRLAFSNSEKVERPLNSARGTKSKKAKKSSSSKKK